MVNKKHTRKFKKKILKKLNKKQSRKLKGGNGKVMQEAMEAIGKAQTLVISAVNEAGTIVSGPLEKADKALSIANNAEAALRRDNQALSSHVKEMEALLAFGP